MALPRTAWKPGQSGNPNGRPKKGRTLTDLIADKLDRDRFVDALLDLAYNKDVAAIKLVLSYIDGPPLDDDLAATARVVEVRYVRPTDNYN